MPFDQGIWNLAGFRKIFSLRMVSAVLGSAAAGLLAMIHPLAGLFLGVHTFAVKYTSVIYLEALPLALSMASVMAMGRFLKWYSALAGEKGKQSGWGWLGISGVTLGLAAASKYMYVVSGAAALLVGLVYSVRKRKPKLLLILAGWGLLAVGVFLAADPALWPDPVGRLAASLQFSMTYTKTAPEIVRAGYPFWQPLRWLTLSIPHQALDTSPFFVRPGDYFILADPLILALAVIGLPRTYRRYPLFFTWLVVGIVCLLGWQTKWPQYVLVILPPLCLSAGMGWEICRDEFEKLKLRLFSAR
jgi:4-amino-4-deoxy-L-arabinose transferase-like glycosyltransferase